MLRDIELFASALGTLDGFGNAGEHLADIVKGKEIAPEAAAPSAEPAKDATQENGSKQDKAGSNDVEKTDNAGDKDAGIKDEETESSVEKPPEPPAKDDADTNSKKSGETKDK